MWSLTRDCLQSLAQHSPPGLYEVIVVDNGSSDETARDLAPLGTSLFAERFRRIAFSENMGFAIASNEGAREASAPLVFFLNNDTRLLPDYFLPLLCAISENANLGAAGPLLLFENGRVQHGGTSFSYGGVQHLYAYFPPNHPVFARERNFQAITAAAMIMRKDIFFAAGGFFEGYQNGFEDIELCCNIVRLGFNLCIISQSRILHLESQTPGRTSQDSKNALLFTQRCGGHIGRDVYSFARADNFSVRLTPDLKTYISLPHKQEAALKRRYADETNLGAILDELHCTPLWQAGYDLACDLARAAGNNDLCLDLAVLKSNFFPLAKNYADLRKIAVTANKLDLAAQATSLLERPKPDHPELVRKARANAALARNDGEADAEAVYLDWIHAYA
jgi:GT2 family glycosyltransferase